ncbi:MAG: SUF system NifU family Fe-S cluster assembly protein [Myxococcales bacterium]|nr:MAG: SUF system NifU family Fe-S cluster assembly protein [Myxococcales bacterium]
MQELRELYQTVILDHNKKPRNFARPERANREAHGHNPLCGDKLEVFAEVDEGVLREVGFLGSGCAISKASASLMTEAVKGKTLAQVEQLFGGFHRVVTSDASTPVDASGLGKLEVFVGVREFPVRVKCATLAWHTLRAALAGDERASTE